VILWVRNE